MPASATLTLPAVAEALDSGVVAPAATLFTPGPVMMDTETCDEGGQQMVYHRTAEFSRRILRCEALLKEACGAAAADRVVMLTGSGTAAMEGAVLNLFSSGEKVLVVNGGDFGRRFAEIAALHGLAVEEAELAPGRPLTAEDLRPFESAGFTGLLVNHHETSTGTLMDLALLAGFCRAHGLLFVVDAIGSFLADPLDMAWSGIDALILSSQKALALPPGMSFVVLSARAVARVGTFAPCSYYLDFGRYLGDIRRGQTPFTPAVGILRQLERRLGAVLEAGVARQVAGVRALAQDFRAKLRGLPFRVFSASPSNAVTALEPLGGVPPAHYVSRLAEEFGLFVCPNGGALRDRIFRVGHLGRLTPADNTRLVAALRALAPSPRRQRAANPQE